MEWEVVGADANGNRKRIKVSASSQESAVAKVTRAGYGVVSIRAVETVTAVRVESHLPSDAPPVLAPHPSTPPPPIVSSLPYASPTQPQTAYVYHAAPSPVNRANNAAGIVSVIFGCVAIAICWIPCVNVMSLPMAGIGLLAALIGVVISLSSGRHAISTSLVGGTLSLVAIGAVFFIGMLFASAANSIATRPPPVFTPPGFPTPPAAPFGFPSINMPARPAVANTSTPANGLTGATCGDALVRIRSAAVSKVSLKTLSGPSQSEEKLLIVTVEISNQHPTRKFSYNTWNEKSRSFSQQRAEARDENGNVYNHCSFGIGSDVVGAVYGSESVYPGKVLTDVLVFEAPTENCQTLLLSLPTENIGGSGTVKLKISMPH